MNLHSSFLAACSIALASIQCPVLAEPVASGARAQPVAASGAPREQRMLIPPTGYEVVVRAGGSPAVRGVPPPRPLVSAVAKWTAIELGLPADLPLPAVKLAAPRKITTFRYTGMLSDHPRDMAGVPPNQRETVAAYDSLTHTVLLPERWSGSTAAELSMLVHELVHHLQVVAGLRYECPQASERLAYDTQQKWLGLFGSDLQREFDLDDGTLLITTQCFY